MKWIAARVCFDATDPELAADLVADIFYSLNLKGVVVEDPHIDPQQDWSEDAVPPPASAAVTGYFADTESAAERCRTLEAALIDLRTRTDIAARVEYTRLDEEDWAEAWKEHFWPAKVTGTIVVKPTWRDYPAAAQEIVLEIDPGMAFGTGTHATTALCLRLIETHLQAGDRFLDVGTGSGILMVAAAKLGAGAICGVDNDPVAVSVAEKNLRVNGITRYRLYTGNLVAGLHATFDVVTANILADVIVDLLPDAGGVIAPGGVLICSGIIAAKRDGVVAALAENGFAVLDCLEEDGWVAIAARRDRRSPGRSRQPVGSGRCGPARRGVMVCPRDAVWRLVLGNDVTGDHPWLGARYQLASCDRALDRKTVAARFAGGQLHHRCSESVEDGRRTIALALSIG